MSIKETGKEGLTRLVRDYLKVAEKIYDIWWVRNQQNIGSTPGRPDFEIGFPVHINPNIKVMELISVELKSPKWRKKLNKYQQREKERLERASGKYYIFTTIEQLHGMFCKRGYLRVKLQ